MSIRFVQFSNHNCLSISDYKNIYHQKLFYISHIFGALALVLFILILWKTRFRYSQLAFIVMYEFLTLYLLFFVGTNVLENIITIISTTILFWITATIADYCPVKITFLSKIKFFTIAISLFQIDLTKPFVVIVISYGAFIGKFIMISNLHFIPGIEASAIISVSCFGMVFTLLVSVCVWTY